MDSFALGDYLGNLAFVESLVEVARMEAGEKEKGGVAP